MQGTILYPTLQTFSQPQIMPTKPKMAVQLKTDKDMCMLGITLICAVILMITSTVFMIFLSRYVIEHRSHSVISGFLEAMIYVILIFNMIYAVGVYYLSAGEESTYMAARMMIFYISLGYEAFHLLVPMVLLAMGSSNPHNTQAFTMLILPDLIEMVVFGASAWGFYKLYKTPKYYLIPMREY